MSLFMGHPFISIRYRVDIYAIVYIYDVLIGTYRYLAAYEDQALANGDLPSFPKFNGKNGRQKTWGIILQAVKKAVNRRIYHLLGWVWMSYSHILPLIPTIPHKMLGS